MASQAEQTIMTNKKQKLELTWIGKETRPRLEPCIAEIEGKLQQRTSLKELFTLRWRLA